MILLTYKSTTLRTSPPRGPLVLLSLPGLHSPVPTHSHPDTQSRCSWHTENAGHRGCHVEAARLVLLAALLLELALLLGRGVLVLLVLGHEVVHVGIGLGELHLVHALAGVPVEEGLAAEHRGELLGDALH